MNTVLYKSSCNTCGVGRYCGTMVSSMKLHKAVMQKDYRKFIHSRKGLEYLIMKYPNSSLLDALNLTYSEFIKY